MNCAKNVAPGLLLSMILFQQHAVAAPTVGETTVLGPFVGIGAPLHPDNLAPRKIRFYGTDLGWTYEHEGKLHIIFGDTLAAKGVNYIEQSTGAKFDDGFGTIDLAQYSDPDRFSADNIPRVKLGQNPDTREMSAIDPGHAMEGFKTPVGGFSNGHREFAIFYISKPEPCLAKSDCANGLTCDNGLGYIGPKPHEEEGHTFACVDRSPGCNPDPMIGDDGATVDGSGLCVNKTSSNWAETDIGRISSTALKHLVGIRSLDDPRKYKNTREWLTTKFINPAVRTVQDFIPAEGGDRSRPDFRRATGASGNQRIFLWGRPGFIGVDATGRDLGLYFAYVDMPANADFTWDVHYYAGIDESGIPRFSNDEKEAVALDLDDTKPGIQAREVHDIVDQMSVAWIDHLGKWVMFYGGGMTVRPNERLPRCGVLEFFTGPECAAVETGNGAIRMRTSDNPWGPWTPAQDVIVGGDPDADPLEHQYAEGGVLYHPRCQGKNCAPSTGVTPEDVGDYGFLYAANIIEQWTTSAGDGVDVIWNASTWNPYRVILLRTRIYP